MTLLLYGTALRDLHDDGMCPPVKGVNMRRKQNACDSNGGVHAERVTANMHDLTYGLKDFFREVFLDKDDIDYERRFDVRSLPLLVVAMAAGWLYSRDGNGFYACVSAIFAVSYTVYFIVNRGAYIVRLFRGENIFGKRRVRCMKYRGTIHSSVAGGLAKALEKFVDNDTLYAYIGGYGVPLLGTATMIAYDASHWLWLALVGGVLCVVYALYWLIYAFVAAHRALIAVLADRDRRLEQAGYRMTVMRRDAKLASRTHDTVTGGLSYIAFIAQQQLEGKPYRTRNGLRGNISMMRLNVRWTMFMKLLIFLDEISTPQIPLAAKGLIANRKKYRCQMFLHWRELFASIVMRGILGLRRSGLLEQVRFSWMLRMLMILVKVFVRI